MGRSYSNVDRLAGRAFSGVARSEIMSHSGIVLRLAGLGSKASTETGLIVSEDSEVRESMESLDDATVRELVTEKGAQTLEITDALVIFEFGIWNDLENVGCRGARKNRGLGHTHDMIVDVTVRDVFVIVSAEGMADYDPPRQTMLLSDVLSLQTGAVIGHALSEFERDHAMQDTAVAPAVIYPSGQVPGAGRCNLTLGHIPGLMTGWTGALIAF